MQLCKICLLIEIVFQLSRISIKFYFLKIFLRSIISIYQFSIRVCQIKQKSVMITAISVKIPAAMAPLDGGEKSMICSIHYSQMIHHE